MILVWRGWGVAVPFITLFFVIVMQLLVDGVTGDSEYYKNHSSLLLLSMVFAATTIWMIGSRLEKTPGRIMVDKDSGQEFELKAKHDLFWIPFKWWAIPLVLIGAVFGAA